MAAKVPDRLKRIVLYISPELCQPFARADRSAAVVETHISASQEYGVCQCAREKSTAQQNIL